MHLLVSVATPAEAAAALAGGADVIDAKDPFAGALGPVPAAVVRAIHDTVGGARPVTAALGDADEEAATERTAQAYAAAGARLVKVGFRGSPTASRIGSLIAAAVRGARAERAGVVAAAYADLQLAAPAGLFEFADLAARSGADGLLLDTADKTGPSLRSLVAADALAAFTFRAHRLGLFVTLAGRLSADDLLFARDAGGDIVGVRGAACEGGRTGQVTAERVRALCAALRGLPSIHGCRADLQVRAFGRPVYAESVF